MELSEYRVSAEDSGVRLDVFLASRNSDAIPSRAFARKLCEHGRVRVNGRIARAGSLLLVGQLVELRPPVPLESTQKLEVIGEGSDFFLIEKPRGLHSVHHRCSSELSVEYILAKQFLAFYESGKNMPPESGLVQRLDYWTSGIMLVARSSAAQKQFQELQLAGKLRKSYLAILTGQAKETRYLLTAAIDAAKRKKVRLSKDGAPAKSQFRILSRDSDSDTSIALIRGSLMRRHQIRAHAASIDHPLLGDTLYGGAARVDGFVLHASALRFPVDGQWHCFRSPNKEHIVERE